MLAHFEDREGGGFFFTADDHERLFHRAKSFADEATPSGNGVAAGCCSGSATCSASQRWLALAAERTLQSAWPSLAKAAAKPTARCGSWKRGAPAAAVILRGEPGAIARWHREIDWLYAPRRMLLAIPTDAGLPAALASKRAPARAAKPRLPVRGQPLRGAGGLAARTRAAPAAATRRPPTEDRDGQRARFPGADDRRPGAIPEGLRRPGPAGRQRRQQVRLHAAIRRPRGAAPQSSGPRLRGARLPLRPVRPPGAGQRARDRELLQADLRRQLPDVRQGRGQWRRCAPAAPST